MLCPIKEARDLAERVCQDDLRKNWIDVTREKIEEVRRDHLRQFSAAQSQFENHKPTCDICKASWLIARGLGPLFDLDHLNDWVIRLHGFLNTAFDLFPQGNGWQRGKQGREIYRRLADWGDGADSELFPH